MPLLLVTFDLFRFESSILSSPESVSLESTLYFYRWFLSNLNPRISCFGTFSPGWKFF